MISPHPHVLIAPLNWGLGHATRCIPIIRELLNQGAKVTICASGGGKIILENHFPGLEFIEIPGVDIRYPEKGSMALHFIMNAPSILKAIRHENKLLNNLIEDSDFTHLISDNRFGFYNAKVKSAFITHQIKIKTSNDSYLIQKTLFEINKNYIHHFKELWIPDLEPPDSLSGDLSDPNGIKIPVKYIGSVSRFTKPNTTGYKQFDIVVLLSGPEPQRTLLEKKLISQLADSGKSVLFVRGLPGETNVPNSVDKIKFLNNIDDTSLLQALHKQTILISRSGYSTVMDLMAIGHQNVFFIPTPGQTEQEYLAAYLKNKYHFDYSTQEDFNLGMLKDNSNQVINVSVPSSNDKNLKKVISDFLI